jgi:hypothetical protein
VFQFDHWHTTIYEAWEPNSTLTFNSKDLNESHVFQFDHWHTTIYEAWEPNRGKEKEGRLELKEGAKL